MKTYLLLASLTIFNSNCQNMKNNNCLDSESFDLLKNEIVENNTTVYLHKRVVADTTIMSKELSANNRYLELIEQQNGEKIIVIDPSNKIPPYSCSMENERLILSAYEARFDTENDIKVRNDDWCDLVSIFRKK